MEVRLAGIGTPQGVWRVGSQGTSHNQLMREYLAELLLHKIVHIKAYGSGSDGLVLAVVYLDGRNINLQMVRAGFAEVHSEGLHKNLDLEPYLRAEQEARKAGRGLWSAGER
jgi:micrococcal nuclease